MIEIGDKLKQIKPYKGLNFKNIELEVVDIQDNLIFVTNKYGTGVLSDDEIGVLFKKVKRWTPWIDMGDIKYKTDNEKYVKVRINTYISKASCHPNDTFNLKIGIGVAIHKIIEKIARDQHISLRDVEYKLFKYWLYNEEYT